MSNNWLKLLILDFDGVIVESVGIKTEAFRKLFSDYPEHLEAIIDFHLSNDGLSRYKKFHHMSPTFLGQSLDKEESARLGIRFTELVLEQIKACPFVLGAVDFLKEYQGRVPIYIASGTPEPELREIVKVRGLEAYFAGLFGSPKTKSEIAKLVLDKEGIAPENCLFVGDTMTDYTEAAKAGVKFIGRWDGKLPPQNPFSRLDTRVVSDLLEMSQLLASEFAAGQIGDVK